MFAICLASCDDDSSNVSSSSELSSFVSSLASPDSETETAVSYSDVVAVDTSANEICTTTSYKSNEQFSELVLLDPTSDVIYVGSILDGQSVDDGSYTPIVLPRASMKISTNFENLSGSGTAVVDEPSLSSVREAIKSMVSDAPIVGSTSAATSFEIKQVHSESEVDVAVGASVKFAGVKISNNFDFSSSAKSSHFLIKYVQTYYTVDMDLPASAADMFASSVTKKQLEVALGESKKVPAYVSSVKYGRIAYFAVESDDDSSSFKDSLNACFKSFAAGSTDTSYKKVLSSCSISGTVLGGSAADAAQAVSGINGMLDYIRNGGNYSDESPAAIVSFTLRKLSDNSVFKVLAGGQYEVTNCVSVFNSVTVAPKYFYGVTQANDVYGSITAQIVYDDGATDSSVSEYLFNCSSSSCVSFSKDKQYAFGQSKSFALQYNYTKFDNAILRISGSLYDHDGTNADDKYYLYSDAAGLSEFSVDYRLSDILNNKVALNSNGYIAISLRNDKDEDSDDFDNFVFALDVQL